MYYVSHNLVYTHKIMGNLESIATMRVSELHNFTFIIIGVIIINFAVDFFW